MKKVLIALLVFFMLFLVSCNNEATKGSEKPYGFKALDYVYLPDYTKLVIDKEDYKVTDEDIERYVYFELLSKEIYDADVLFEDMENSTILKRFNNSIAKRYYGFETAHEAIKSFKKSLEKERVWEIFFEYISEYAYAKKFPVEKDEYIKSDLEIIESEALKNQKTVEEYIKELYNFTLYEYKEMLTYTFLEIMVIKALADNEGIVCTEEEYNDEIENLSVELELSEEETVQYYGEYGIYTNIYSRKLKDKIISRYSTVR